MRKFLWLALGFVIVIALSNFVHAAEFGTDKSIDRMADEKFQQQQQIAACKMIYGKTDKSRRCYVANIKAYNDVINTLQEMYDAVEAYPALADTLAYKMAMECMFDTISYYWMPNYDTAPWLKVRDTALNCMKEKKKQLD